jgi:hypothetical protein
MRYWILPAIVSWFVVFSITAARDNEVPYNRAFQDQMFAVLVGAYAAFCLVGIVQKAIRIQGLSNWPTRLAFRASRNEPAPVKLNDRLLVEEEIQASGGAPISRNEADAAAAQSGDVQRLYEVLDE